LAVLAESIERGDGDEQLNRNRAGNVWIEANIAKLPALLGKP
jgi:hypothetical protein